MRSLSLCLLLVLPLEAQKYGVGRAPTAAEMKAMDISVSPDGRDLPDGSGDVAQGKEIYARRCQRCHGENGKGGDEAALVGGTGTLNTPKPLKTVGSFWPYATTLFDYVRRAMPYKDPGTLSNPQVYAVVAFILNLNGIVPDNAVMSRDTLPKVEMPNRKGFVPDARPDTGKRAARPNPHR